MFILSRYVERKNLILKFILRILVRVSFVLSPFFLGKFINAVNNKNLDFIYKYLIYIVSLFVISQVLFYLDDLLYGKIETDTYKNIFYKGINKICSFDEKSATINPSQIHQEFGQNYELIKKFFFDYPIEVFVNAIYIVALFIMLLSMSYIIAFTVLSLIPLFILFSYTYEKKINKASKSWMNSIKTTRDYLVDTYNFRHLLRNNNHHFTEADTIADSYLRSSKRKYRLISFFENVLSYSSLNFMILLVNIISGIQVYKGTLSIGEFAAISLYVSHMWTPIEAYVTIYSEYISKKIIMKSFSDFLEAPDIKTTDESISSIELQDYKLFERQNELNIRLERGNVYLVTGDNGSGKTTLFKNIISVTDNYFGQIIINDKIKNNIRYNKICFFPSEVYESDFFKSSSLSNKSMGEKKLFLLSMLEEMDNYDVYLIDEPTNYLQQNKKEAVHKLLHHLAQKDKIVLISTHDEVIIKGEYNIICLD